MTGSRFLVVPDSEDLGFGVKGSGFRSFGFRGPGSRVQIWIGSRVPIQKKNSFPAPGP